MGLFDTTVPSTTPADSEAFKLGASRIRGLQDTLQKILAQIFATASTWVVGGIPAQAIGQGTTAGLLRAQLNADAAIPTGVVWPYASITAPTGWLICDGSSQPQASYSALFALIGSSFGAIVGTDFILPDLRGRVPVGLDTMGAGAASRLTANGALAPAASHPATVLGVTGGAQNNAMATTEMPAHIHAPAAGTSILVAPSPAQPGTAGGGATMGNPTTIASAGGGLAHNNMPPYQLFAYIIKT